MVLGSVSKGARGNLAGSPADLCQLRGALLAVSRCKWKQRVQSTKRHPNICAADCSLYIKKKNFQLCGASLDYQIIPWPHKRCETSPGGAQQPWNPNAGHVCLQGAPASTFTVVILRSHSKTSLAEQLMLDCRLGVSFFCLFETELRLSTRDRPQVRFAR